MANNDGVLPPPGFSDPTAASEIVIGGSRHIPGRPPFAAYAAPSSSNSPPADPIASLTRTVERIVARLDILETRDSPQARRSDVPRPPPQRKPDPDPPYVDAEEDEFTFEDFYSRSRRHKGVAASDFTVDGGGGYRSRRDKDRNPPVFNHPRGEDSHSHRGAFVCNRRRPTTRAARGHAEDSRGDRRHPQPFSSWDRPPSEPHSEDEDSDDSQQRSVWEAPPKRDRRRHSRHELPKGFKMDPPRFDGSEASSWIARVQYYFDHLRLPESERLHYVVMLFQQPAAEWVFNYANNNRVVSWKDFLEDVRHRFEPQSFRNVIGPLSKLVQTGTVAEYHAAFEKYLNRVEGLSESALIPMFIAGLQEPIQEKVELQQPQSLSEAMALALRLAASQEERRSHLARTRWRDSRPAAGAPATPIATGVTPPSSAREGEHAGPKPIRVSASEKSERSKRGLCYYCPERWTRGHVCQTRMLAYFGEEEDAADAQDDERASDEDIITDDLSHLKALDSNSRATPFRVVGSIDHTSVSILIDTGSTHDFLHSRIAAALRLPLTPISPFRVYVGNGASITCGYLARATGLLIQGVSFNIDFHILDIHGSDVILGMAWLESLGKIAADFVGKTLEFRVAEETHIIRGLSPSPRQISLQGLMLLSRQSAGHEFYELVQLETTQPSAAPSPAVEFPADLPAAIRAVLERFAGVFAVPTGLPPKRDFDHHIHLLPHTKPINVRPYRYPYFQKNEIERQVREMLEQGLIQRSQSPFSSPVLLIRKKDGTFRFCIDYRALNMATVPDHFPIPTADELFDELGHAKYFSKLDLRSSYHQIRMHDSDIFKTAFRTHEGHFEFLVMPFGLTNAPSTFQAAMNGIFQPLLRRCVIVFFDDILVYSRSLEEHSGHLEEVLALLLAHKFFVKLSKCVFCHTTVEYLGHLITDGLLKADPTKIDAMVAWPTPKSVKQLRGFLGLTGYYRRFVARYSMIAAPLTELLKKEAFAWSDSAQAAFDVLKVAMTSAPVLSLPDFQKPFCVETDASDVGIGAVLI